MADRLKVGIDISSKYHDVCCLGPDGKVVLNHRRFANTPAGQAQLQGTVRELVQQGGYAGADVGVESTGLLWFHLLWGWRQARGDDGLYLLDPYAVDQFRKAVGEADKTDKKDARVIAERLRFRQPEHQVPMDVRYLPLQRLTRYRYALVKQLASEKVRLSNLIYLKASAYRSVAPFTDIFGAASRQVLSDYASLDEVAAIPIEELAAYLQAVGHSRFAEPEQTAARLHAAAVASFRLPDELATAVNTVLEIGLQNLQSQQSAITALDRAIRAQAEGLPGVKLLRSVPGIGPVFAAGLVAEIGDPQRFLAGTKRDARGRERAKTRQDAEASVAKLAGLFWPRHQSGDFTGEDRPMSKRGNVYLRYYLIEAANSVRMHDATYAAFYKRKYAEAVRHPHRRALVLTGRKLVRLVVALLLDGEPYHSQESPSVD
jgi:transposase